MIRGSAVDKTHFSVENKLDIAIKKVRFLAILWDKQHVLMQQHGFARIYDFKAQAGAPSTSRFDLLLNWTLFLNLFLTSPLFTPI